MCSGNENPRVMVRERGHNPEFIGIVIYTLKHVFDMGQSRGKTQTRFDKGVQICLITKRQVKRNN
jgi:hypothetical protein